MATGLTSPTGANQYTDTNYVLPGMSTGASSSTSDPGTGFEMFSGGANNSGTSPVPAGGVAPVTPPGVVPQQSTPISPTQAGPGGLSGPKVAPPYNPVTNPAGPVGGVANAGSGNASVTPLYPDFTQQFYNYLSSQMGQGATPFNLSAIMPSSGQATTPGALSAPEDQLNQMLQQFYQTGSGGPTGSGTLQSMAQTGNPTDVGPAWNAMLSAENQNTQNNAANLREQFASGGNLQSSPFGNAMSQFYQQNTLNQNAQLTAAEQQAQEAASGRQLTAASDLTSGATGMAANLQSMDQSAIQNMLAEFIRTSPDYSPLLSQIGGAATTFPPTISGSVGVGGMGGAVGSAGTALSGIADLWSALSNSNSKPTAGSTPPVVGANAG